MALIKPFRALRPPKALAERVAALPYDVMNVEEARAMAVGNPYSFLHISRAEIDLSPDVDPHDDQVYEKGRENLEQFIAQGTLVQDASDCYYVYRQTMGSIAQTGLVACSAVDDYRMEVIKKHELTRADKEEDRVQHIDRLDANDEPVFYTYRHDAGIAAIIDAAAKGEPEYDFTTSDGVSHTLWAIRGRETIDRLTALFGAIDTLYVADGHHRSAAASRVAELRRAADQDRTGEKEYDYFLTVIFPDNEMNIMPYNRVVKDLSGASAEDFLEKVAQSFTLRKVDSLFTPVRRHSFGMYLDKDWYELAPKEGTFDEANAVARLDVSILQNNLLAPVLGIENPRTDQRIHFVGGIRGTGELVRLVDGGEYLVAFSLFPTSITELMELADAGKIMPPKSTWFEPKLRSGLFVHLLR